MFPGLNWYKAMDKVSCSRIQHSAYGEARTSDPLTSSSALYHRTLLFPHLLDKYLSKKETIHSLTLCIPETNKQVILQTVKIQMKCKIMLHFIRVYTVCKGKKDLQTKEYNIFFKIITGQPQICTMDYPKLIVSNQKEESISIHGNGLHPNPPPPPPTVMAVDDLCSSFGLDQPRS